MESPGPGRVEARGPGRSWEPVCDLPCDRDLPSADIYRVSGEGFRTSHEFSLHGSAMSVRVDPIDRGKRTVGLVLMPVGGVLAVMGAALVVYGVDPSGIAFRSNSRAADATAVTAGIATLGVGATAAVVGALLFFKNNNSRIEPGPLPDPRTRPPAWADSSPKAESVASPGTWLFPLQGAF